MLEKSQGRHGLNGNKPAVGVIHNPWEDLRDGFDTAGWLNLTNARGTLKIEGGEMEQADRPRRPAHQAGPVHTRSPASPSESADFSMGVVHAPYLRTLRRVHGGRLPPDPGRSHPRRPAVLPFYGAFVTNCDLDTDRVKGLSTHTAEGRTSYMHVSAGCGTSYTRFGSRARRRRRC